MDLDDPYVHWSKPSYEAESSDDEFDNADIRVTENSAFDASLPVLCLVGDAGEKVAQCIAVHTATSILSISIGEAHVAEVYAVPGRHIVTATALIPLVDQHKVSGALFSRLQGPWTVISSYSVYTLSSVKREERCGIFVLHDGSQKSKFSELPAPNVVQGTAAAFVQLCAISQRPFRLYVMPSATEEPLQPMHKPYLARGFISSLKKWDNADPAGTIDAEELPSLAAELGLVLGGPGVGKGLFAWLSVRRAREYKLLKKSVGSMYM